MKNLGRVLKAAASGFSKAFEPARYKAAGLQISCTHCKGELFREHEALFNTAGATFVGLEWLNKSGIALACENCGLIQWYAKRPERLQA